MQRAARVTGGLQRPVTDSSLTPSGTAGNPPSLRKQGKKEEEKQRKGKAADVDYWADTLRVWGGVGLFCCSLFWHNKFCTNSCQRR